VISHLKALATLDMGKERRVFHGIIMELKTGYLKKRQKNIHDF
jgi:hypothetical protein